MKRFYHATPLKNRTQVLRMGLSPRRAPEAPPGTPPGVYLTDSFQTAVELAVTAYELGQDEDVLHGTSLGKARKWLILSVNLPDHIDVIEDPELRGQGFIALGTIDPMYLKTIAIYDAKDQDYND